MGNFLEMLMQNPGAMQMAQQEMQQPQMPQPQMPQQIAQPKKRLSFLDTIGQISDAIAQVGGAEPLYQPTLDAREDRAQQIDLDAMRKTLLQQQVAQGEMAPQNDMRARMGMALGAIAENPDSIQFWDQLAGEAQLDPQQAARIGGFLKTNPQAAGPLARMFGYEPQKQGSLPASVQNYAMYQQILAEQGPEAAEQFLRVALPQNYALSPYQQGQLQDRDADRSSRERIAVSGIRSRERIASTRGEAAASKKGASPQSIAEGAKPVVASLRDAINRLHQSGGMTDSQTSGLGIAKTIARENIPFVERFASPEGFSAREDLERLLTVGIPALLPLMGGLALGGKNIDATKELETWRKAIASAKDYPSAIRAVEGFERRITELDGLANTPVPAPRQGGSGRPKIRPRGNAGTPAPRRRYNPQTGRIE